MEATPGMLVPVWFTPVVAGQFDVVCSRVADELSVDFYADEYTAKLLPISASNIWTMAVEPGKFKYGLRREAMHRRFRVESISRSRRRRLHRRGNAAWRAWTPMHFTTCDLQCGP